MSGKLSRPTPTSASALVDSITLKAEQVQMLMLMITTIGEQASDIDNLASICEGFSVVADYVTDLQEEISKQATALHALVPSTGGGR